MAHLSQVIAALPKMTLSCLIAMDDTVLRGGSFWGKGGLAVPYLLHNGFGGLMRFALLYFGLLNTFDLVHSDYKTPNLPAALREIGVVWDADLDTSELSFLKIPRDKPTESIDTGGREVLGRQDASKKLDRDYLVLRDPAESITAKFLAGVRGANTTKIQFTPADPATWTEPGLLNKMILTFISRKARLVRTAIEESESVSFWPLTSSGAQATTKLEPTSAASDQRRQNLAFVFWQTTS